MRRYVALSRFCSGGTLDQEHLSGDRYVVAAVKAYQVDLLSSVSPFSLCATIWRGRAPRSVFG